ncbi:RNA polymerase sigma factor [Chryseolinea lacunae]|uniref:Sigma-70 family RNA polymerase sigma factor n=1 Tax=Chryseolinea lacunae TaxID=2801331 RepID=A0ABS1KYF0_9BACT|nr:sigma-70 family RNA polymerase sigma factor [Chryseolinea lacunae]
MNTTIDKEEFIRIIRENRRIIYKIVYTYCSDPDDRKDLEQEMLIQLWQSLKNYDSNYRLSTWLYKVCLNVAISHYRKEKKHTDGRESLDVSIFKMADEGQDEIMSERTQRLHTFINQLDKLNKAVIILHLEGHSHKETADILGISESNVGTKMHRIKNLLKQNFSTTPN